jgi:hypothetical protein
VHSETMLEGRRERLCHGAAVLGYANDQVALAGADQPRILQSGGIERAVAPEGRVHIPVGERRQVHVAGAGLKAWTCWRAAMAPLIPVSAPPSLCSCRAHASA